MAALLTPLASQEEASIAAGGTTSPVRTTLKRVAPGGVVPPTGGNNPAILAGAGNARPVNSPMRLILMPTCACAS